MAASLAAKDVEAQTLLCGSQNDEAKRGTSEFDGPAERSSCKLANCRTTDPRGCDGAGRDFPLTAASTPAGNVSASLDGASSWPPSRARASASMPVSSTTRPCCSCSACISDRRICSKMVGRPLFLPLSAPSVVPRGRLGAWPRFGGIAENHAKERRGKSCERNVHVQNCCATRLSKTLLRASTFMQHVLEYAVTCYTDLLDGGCQSERGCTNTWDNSGATTDVAPYHCRRRWTNTTQHNNSRHSWLAHDHVLFFQAVVSRPFRRGCISVVNRIGTTVYAKDVVPKRFMK